MPKITKIEVQKKNKRRYSIYLDDVFAFGVHEDVLIEYNLVKGMILDKEFIENVLKFEELKKASNYALKYISYRPRSEKEVIDKMTQNGYENELIEYAINEMKRFGYLDDKQFALMFTRDKINIKQFGKQRLIAELYKKGINRNIIDEVIDKLIEPDEEFERALAFAKKKLRMYRNDEYIAKKRKLSNTLAGRGFNYDIISKVINEVLNKKDYENNSDF